MFARTDRLLLRPAWVEDAPALAEVLDDWAIARNLARVPHPFFHEDAVRFAAGSADEPLPKLLAFVRTLGAPRLVGGIGLHALPGGEAELGLWIARRYWGLGFATEAGRAMVAAARDTLKLPRLISAHAVDNPGSSAVLRKLGFRPTGRLATRTSVGRGEAMPCVEFELPLAGEGGRGHDRPGVLAAA